MTLNDVVKRVKDRSYKGSASTTTDLVTEQIIRAINDTRRKLVRNIPKEFLRKTSTVSVVLGTTTYSLASDVQEPLLFRYTVNSVEHLMTKVPSEREFYDMVYSASAASGKPTHYFDAGRDASGYRQIILFPTPDASYTVAYTYYKDPTRTELTTADLGTEFPDIPSYLQDALVSGTLWQFLKCFDDKDAEDRARMEFDRDLLDLEVAEEKDLDFDGRMRFDINGSPDLGSNGMRIY